MILEKGLNRFKDSEIQEDTYNQTKAKLQIEEYLRVDIETMPMMSIWDWEIYKDGYLVAIGEYRRRFCKFGTFKDFQFSKKKFLTMKEKGKADGVYAYMFVEFDDLFLYFNIKGEPETKIMRRNHEVRTEECVCIPNQDFRYLSQIEI